MPPVDSPELAPDAARVLRQFRQIFNAVKTHFQQMEKRAGMGGAQLWALHLIQANPDMGVNALAEAMDIHQSTASNLVRTLVQQQCVAVIKREDDARKVRLRILPAGLKAVRRAPAPLTGVLPQALSSLDPRTLARLEKDLDVLLRRLDIDDKAARIPLANL
jgi:DNA-binding MarR family transcriptional regulator